MALSVISITPSSANIGDTVIITGTEFDETTTVYFYDNIPAIINSYTDTELEVIVPEGTTPGLVSVTNSGGLRLEVPVISGISVSTLVE